MMNISSISFMTLLTNKISPNHSVFTCIVPSKSVTFNRTALPTWMANSIIKLGLPFTHTLTTTKIFITVEVANGSAKLFTAPTALSSFLITSTRIRLTNSMVIVAFFRTILLRTFASMSYVLTTLSAFVNRCFPKSTQSVTSQRTIFRIRVTIKRVVCLTANLANHCNSITSSIFNSQFGEILRNRR